MKTLFSNLKKDYIPFVTLLMGAPGVGKGTQYNLIASLLEWLGFKVLCVATGDFCRAIAKDDSHPLHVEFVEKNKLAVEAGKLVDDEMIFKILRHELKALNISQFHFIFLDGVIRTANQMPGVFTILQEINSQLKFNLTLDFNATKEVCVARAENRRQEAINAGKEPRKDDEKEAIEVRHQEYQTASLAVRPFAQMVGTYKLIGAEGKPEQIHAIVREAFSEILFQYFSPKTR
jgi:adenylate kinase family enzyme